jgi:hypothetical protein
MADRRNWSREEVEAAVADYFAMFRKELLGQEYSKAEHRRDLLPLLDRRTEGSIEYKHQNISATLIDLGLPYIEGYKPQRNYQDLLFDVVEARVAASSDLLRLVGTTIDAIASAPPPSVDDILARLIEAPKGREKEPQPYAKERRRRPGRKLNYLELEARNHLLGRKGEAFVLNFERARLVAAGADRLAGKIEHVAVTRGDHVGFDVLSFETDGRERLIEAKTTGFGVETPFFVTPNEIDVSRRAGDRYHIYRMHRFRVEPRLFVVNGPVDERFNLEATEFRAQIQ